MFRKSNLQFILDAGYTVNILADRGEYELQLFDSQANYVMRFTSTLSPERTIDAAADFIRRLPTSAA